MSIKIELEYPGVDNIHVPEQRVPRYEARGWRRADGTELKGKALDEALDAAGLSKDGSADEKRARLADHQPGA